MGVPPPLPRDQTRYLFAALARATKLDGLRRGGVYADFVRQNAILYLLHLEKKNDLKSQKAK